MTLNAKKMTNLAVATLMVAISVWVSMKVMSPSQRIVGVVEIGEIQ